MYLEAISFTFNLGFFTCLVWSIFSLRSIRLTEKIKKIPHFLGFAFLFYLLFYFLGVHHAKIFELKSIYFNGYTIFFQLFIFGSLYFFADRDLEIYATIFSMISSPYLFLLLFGLEEFTFWDNSILSYSLLKTQNPIIGLVALFLFFIKPNKIQIPAVALVIGLLFHHVNPLKIFPYPEISILYYKYIPHEFFLHENAYIFEENSGIYTEKKQEGDDMLYKFTMKPIKKIKHPLKQTIQTLISTFDFPILLSEGNTITLLDLSRSYNHSIFKVIFQMNHRSDDKQGLDNAIIKIEGPIF